MRGLLLCALSIGLAACVGQRGSSPYTAGAGERTPRDTERAAALNSEAAELMSADPAEAGRLLRESLAADLFFGPAHNNLGVLHLERGELYEAAHEFEWARKLLPGHPDPRLNLAIALDRAGRTEDSAEAFEAALEVAPGYVPAVQGLARLHLERRIEDERIPAWLRRIVMEGESERWRAWASERLTLDAR